MIPNVEMLPRDTLSVLVKVVCLFFCLFLDKNFKRGNKNSCYVNVYNKFKK